MREPSVLRRSNRDQLTFSACHRSFVPFINSKPANKKQHFCSQSHILFREAKKEIKRKKHNFEKKLAMNVKTDMK